MKIGHYKDGTPIEIKANENAKNLIIKNLSGEHSLDLSELGKCASLSRLFIDITGKQPSLDLSPLARCRKLQSLTIGCGSISTLDLSPLQNNAELQNFALQSKLSSLDLSPIASWKKLKLLGLGTHCASLALRPISGLSQLEELNLGGEKLAFIDLSGITGLASLKEVFITNSPKLKSLDLSPFAAAPSLRCLIIGNNKSLSIDLSPFAAHKKLKVLNLNGIREAWVSASTAQAGIKNACLKKYIGGLVVVK